MFIEREEIDIQENEERVFIYFNNEEMKKVWILKLEEYKNNKGIIEREIYRLIDSWGISSCYFNFFSY